MTTTNSANSKAPLSKDELRRLMKERSTKKIDAPFAKYDSAGQLTCIICKCQVKSEAVWTAHINGRQHLQSITSAQSSTRPKPSSNVTPGGAPLKKSAETVITKVSEGKAEKRRQDVVDDSSMKKLKVSDRVDNVPEGKSQIPADFFDSPDPAPQTKPPPTAPPSTQLPDNFFDKPTKNIKQKQEREKKAQEEDDWLAFQKAINEESHKSSVIVEHDDAEAKRQRELDEIEEQLLRLEKLHDLELKKEEVAKKLAETESVAMDTADGGQSEDSDDGEDFNLMDWRRRKLW